jgi:hypothetical protein
LKVADEAMYRAKLEHRKTSAADHGADVVVAA